jgi:hypothetical protein
VAPTAATVCEQCGRFLTITAGVPDTSSPEFSSSSDSSSTYTSFTAASTPASDTTAAATADATAAAASTTGATSGDSAGTSVTASNSLLQHPLMQLDDAPSTVDATNGCSNGSKSNAGQCAPQLSRSTGRRGHLARRASVFVSPLPADSDTSSADTSPLL